MTDWQDVARVMLSSAVEPEAELRVLMGDEPALAHASRAAPDTSFRE